MVRTSSGTIRISSGKYSKKGSSGSSSGSGNSTASTKSSSKGSSRLPPIPRTETPPWQKPITSFFGTSRTNEKGETHEKTITNDSNNATVNISKENENDTKEIDDCEEDKLDNLENESKMLPT